MQLEQISFPGDEFWDYVFVESSTRRAYISRGPHVLVLDLDSMHVVSTIEDTVGVRRIAIAPGLSRGFTNNGRANIVTIADTNEGPARSGVTVLAKGQRACELQKDETTFR